MRAVSQRFLRALTGSHNPVAEVWSIIDWTPGGPSVKRVGVDPNLFGDSLLYPGRTAVKMPFEDGAVNLDGRRANRATATVVFPAKDADGKNLFPYLEDDRLAPYGQELFIRRGIEFARGDVEWVSYGFFRIDDVDQNGISQVITVTASDRMSDIVDARMLAPRQFSSSATYGEFVDNLVSEVFPFVQDGQEIWEFDDPELRDTALGRIVTVEQDRYEALRDTFVAHGKIVYFDHRGIFRVASPSSFTWPLFHVHNEDRGTLIHLNHYLNRTRFYNAVVAFGEEDADGVAIREAVVDDNPKSPTYFFGHFGQVPRYFYSSFFRTATQARVAAREILRRYTGLPAGLTFDTNNPALEPFDNGLVTYPGRSEARVLDTVNIPLVPGVVTAKTRILTIDETFDVEVQEEESS